MTNRELPTAEELHKLFVYYPATGNLVWRERPVTRQQDKTWNARFAGQIVGNKASDNRIGITLGKRKTRVHRVVWKMMTGKDAGVIDHINGDASDNRWANLRNVTPSENSKNLSKPKNNKSGKMGVSFCKKSSRWLACISVRDRTVHLGQFVQFSDAVAAREAAEIRYGFHKNHGRQSLRAEA